LNIPIHADADIPYGGLCFAVRVPDDIRILLNLKDGMSDYQTLFHEFGHAVHRKFVAAKPYALRVGETGFFAEGMADVWALFVNRPSWLRANTKLTAAEVDAVAANAARIFAVRTRRFMAAQLVEIQIYRDLDGDWDRYYDEASRRYLGVATGPDIWKEFYFPHLYPVYNKNYMLARVIQRGVHARLEREFGDFLGQPAAFDFLVTHLYAPGASLPWKEKLARVEVAI
jgi:oligoendopeptidase F